MPTVLRVGPYRFFFYAADGNEPPHVHVERDEAEAKYWLDPVQWERSHGFAARELRSIDRIIRENQSSLLEAWHEFFNG
jgi:hypothetical protein